MSENLAATSWIPVRDLTGRRHDESLRGAFLQAHELSAVEHPVPIVEAGVWRLLVAIALDIFRPTTTDDLADMLAEGKFDQDAVEKYFDRNLADFELFSAKRPFLQDATAGGEEKSIAALLPSRPSGTNAVHWQHGREEGFAVTPAEAALLLTTIAPFMTAGGAGLAPSINGAPPWYVMILGRTLFESIVLNLWVQAEHPDLKRGDPAWRRKGPLETTERRVSTTLLEGLTWMPRRIKLIPGPGGRSALSGEQRPVLVHRMYFTAGQSCAFEWPAWVDPNVAYSISKERVTPVRPQEDKEPWRDAGALALLDQRTSSDVRRSVRPAIISQFARMAQDDPELDGGSLRIRLYGMRTDLKMKVFEWYREQLALPLPLVLRSELALRLLKAIEDGDEVRKALRRSLETAVTSDTHTGDTHTAEGEASALVAIATRMFWPALEQPFFNLARILAGMAEAKAVLLDEAMSDWRTVLSRTAKTAFDAATRGLRRDAQRLIAIERGRDRLTRELWRSARPPTEDDQGGSSKGRSPTGVSPDGGAPPSARRPRPISRSRP